MASSPSDLSSASSLLEMVTGFWVSQAIQAAATLGVADHLQHGQKHFEELAKLVGAHPRSLFRLLRALSAKGIFQEVEDSGNFKLTPMASLLLSDAEPSLRGVAMYHPSPPEYRSWGNILHSIKTGENAFAHTWGSNLFEHLEKTPEQAALFNGAMTSYSKLEGPEIVKAYDFSTASTLMDVGGGKGFLLGSILRATPGLKGVLFDLPHVVKGTNELAGLVPDRCEIKGGNFFKEIPTGADVIIMKTILHDWSREHQETILRKCHKALPAGGKVLIVERVIPKGNADHSGKWMDLNMLVCSPGGVEYREDEWKNLLYATGFAFDKVVPVEGSGVAIVEAVKEGITVGKMSG